MILRIETINDSCNPEGTLRVLCINRRWPTSPFGECGRLRNLLPFYIDRQWWVPADMLGPDADYAFQYKGGWFTVEYAKWLF